jgi:hypothetical protein
MIDACMFLMAIAQYFALRSAACGRPPSHVADLLRQYSESHTAGARTTDLEE